MTKEEILKRVNKFQGANREFSQELPPIIEGLVDLIDEAGPEVVDNLESNDPDKALSANMGKELNVSKMDAPSVTGEAGQILQLDEDGNPEWVEAAAVGATYDSTVSDTSTNAIQNKTIKKYVDDNFAQKNGYYASLTAGAAENLVGRGSVPAEFAFRTSGGDQDLGTGSALIAKILGRTEAWNQLVQNGDFSDGMTGWSSGNGTTMTINSDGSIRVTNDIEGNENFDLRRLFAIPSGHKVYLTGEFRSSSNTIINPQVNNNASRSISLPASVKTRVSLITTALGSSTIQRIFYVPNAGDRSLGAYIDVFRVNFIDLTLLYGAGNEPTTVAEFEALHPLPYYNYNAGVLKNNAATGLETVGFNQWDEEWEEGNLNDNGVPISAVGRIRSKNYTRIIPTATYYYNFPNVGGSYTAFVYYYDAEHTFISREAVRQTISTVPSNAQFLKFACVPNYGTTYKNDICINLSWSGYRNGEYKPYEEHTLALPLDAIACHDEDNNAVVVNGLDGVGTSQDELIVENGWGTKIIKRRGRRAYQAGDESDATLMTDGTNTDYPLATPITLTVDEPFAASYYINDFGTEARLPQDTADDPQAPFCAEIQYAMNATDTLRRLPSQYISDESMTNILTALKTAGIIADFTLTYDSEHQYYTCSITAPTTEGE